MSIFDKYIDITDIPDFYVRRSTMNISFTEKQEEYISSQIKQGDYQNASEAVHDALSLHEV